MFDGPTLLAVRLRTTSHQMSFLPHVAGKPTTATKKSKRNRQSDVHRQPPRPSARRQDLEEDRGRDHHHSLYSCEATATFAGGSGVRNWCVHSQACRGFLVINLGGICSYVGKHRRWDDNYRNDSLHVVSGCCAGIATWYQTHLKYRRHNKRKEKMFKRLGEDEALSINLEVACAQFCQRCRRTGRLLFWASGDSPAFILPFSAFFFFSAVVQRSSLTLHTIANSVQTSQLSPQSEGPGLGR